MSFYPSSVFVLLPVSPVHLLLLLFFPKGVWYRIQHLPTQALDVTMLWWASFLGKHEEIRGIITVSARVAGRAGSEILHSLGRLHWSVLICLIVY